MIISLAATAAWRLGWWPICSRVRKSRWVAAVTTSTTRRNRIWESVDPATTAVTRRAPAPASSDWARRCQKKSGDCQRSRPSAWLKRRAEYPAVSDSHGNHDPADGIEPDIERPRFHSGGGEHACHQPECARPEYAVNAAVPHNSHEVGLALVMMYRKRSGRFRSQSKRTPVRTEKRTSRGRRGEQHLPSPLSVRDDGQSRNQEGSRGDRLRPQVAGDLPAPRARMRGVQGRPGGVRWPLPLLPREFGGDQGRASRRCSWC